MLLRTLSCSTMLLSLAALAGCTLPVRDAAPNSTAQSITAQGRVFGGQQPVAGATIQLYAVGTSGDYSAATPLISSPPQTDSNGNFSITGQYSCGSATQVFIVATGGNSGSGQNANLALMTALGSCSSMTANTFININELTTVSAVAAMHLFMSGPTALGSSSYDASALAQDVTLATQLVSTPRGVAPGDGVPAGYSVPAPLLNTLGDILASCVNSQGGTAGDGSACGTLFALSPSSSGAVPTDTITAMLNVMNHPTLNTTALFNLASSSAPFQPELTSAPASFQVQLGYSNAPAVTRQLLVEPDDGITPLYNLVNGAQSTLDLTVYGLLDTTFSGDLVADCQRGVIVRVILDVNDEQTTNQAAYNQLNAQQNCTAVWANTRYPATHEKSFVVDGKTLAMLTLNIETRDYPMTRDFALISNDPGDAAAFEATFNADFTQTYPYVTTPGTDLIWSPTTAQTSLVGIINNATQSLWVENEEMSAKNIVSALEAACQRGVTVNITMTNQTSYHANFSALEAAGCGVHVYANSTKVLYIHAKTILADYGTPAQYAYMGSINFSTASMVENRELGLYVYDSSVLQRLYSTLNSDYAGAPAY